MAVNALSTNFKYQIVRCAQKTEQISLYGWQLTLKYVPEYKFVLILIFMTNLDEIKIATDRHGAIL